MIPKIAKKSLDFVKAHKVVIDRVKDGISTAASVRNSINDGFQATKSVAALGMKGAWNLANNKAMNSVADPTGKLGVLGKFGIGGAVFGTVTGLASIPGQVGTAFKDVRAAVRSGSRADEVKATSSTITAARTTLGTIGKGLNTAVKIQKIAVTYKAASTAFKAAVPGASKALTAAAAKAATVSVFAGATKGAIRDATLGSVKNLTAKAVNAAAHEGGTLAQITGTAGRAAARAALREGGEVAAEAAVKAGARAAAGGLAKTAARFTPGLNIAMAALDTAQAISTVRDPKASTGKKVCSVITAVGSIASATNIPVVSQIGAAVSVVSGFVGAFF